MRTYVQLMHVHAYTREEANTFRHVSHTNEERAQLTYAYTYTRGADICTQHAHRHRNAMCAGRCGIPKRTVPKKLSAAVSADTLAISKSLSRSLSLVLSL